MIQRVFGDRPRQFMLADDLTPAGFAWLSVQGRFSDSILLSESQRLVRAEGISWGREHRAGTGAVPVWGSRALLNSHSSHLFKSQQIFSFPAVL